MALTKKTLADFVRYRMSGGTDLNRLGLKPYQIYKWEKDAIDRLIRRDLKLDEYSEKDMTEAERARAMLYVIPYNDITCNQGVIDLSTEADAGMLLETIHLYGSVNNPNYTYPFQYVQSEAELIRPKSLLWGYYTIRGTSLILRDSDGSIGLLGCPPNFTIFAAKIPDITEVPRSREAKLVDIMLELWGEALQPGAVEQEAEK